MKTETNKEKNAIHAGIDTEDYSISIDIYKKFKDSSEINNTLMSVLNAANTAINNLLFESSRQVSIVVPENNKEATSAPAPRDNNIVRKRIPNDIDNVVDINSLKISKAPINTPLMRCPCCGQAHCAAIVSDEFPSIYFMERQYDKNEFAIISKIDKDNGNDEANKKLLDMCCKDYTDKKLYFEDLQKLTASDEDFIASGTTELYCPVCHATEMTKTWEDAFKNPLKYFDTEYLCDACGGELVNNLSKGKEKIMKCEVCGHIQ